MSARLWRLLVVDDEKTIADQNKDLLLTGDVVPAGDRLEIDVETDFFVALRMLAGSSYDLLVLDIRDQNSQLYDAETGNIQVYADSGVEVFEKVRSSRFVPIEFFTAVPDRVEGQDRPPFVAVVDKGGEDPITDLRNRVREVFESTLPTLHRALMDHVERVTREFMESFVEPRWSDLTEPTRKGDLAHLLLRRLARSLDTGADALRADLVGDAGIQLVDEAVHPMRFYVMPSVDGYTTGDLLVGPPLHPSRARSPKVPLSRTTGGADKATDAEAP